MRARSNGTTRPSRLMTWSGAELTTGKVSDRRGDFPRTGGRPAPPRPERGVTHVSASMKIECLELPASPSDLEQLAALLVDAVDSGASVSFMPPLSLDDAARWWRTTLEEMRPRGLCLVARDEDGIVGTVQLHPAWAPNQPHRADVAKLLVHRRARRRGIGRALMQALETQAAAAGFTLLTLDTCRGDAAERLYRELGRISAGDPRSRRRRCPAPARSAEAACGPRSRSRPARRRCSPAEAALDELGSDGDRVPGWMAGRAERHFPVTSGT